MALRKMVSSNENCQESPLTDAGQVNQTTLSFESDAIQPSVPLSPVFQAILSNKGRKRALSAPGQSQFNSKRHTSFATLKSSLGPPASITYVESYTQTTLPLYNDSPKSSPADVSHVDSQFRFFEDHQHTLFPQYIGDPESAQTPEDAWDYPANLPLSIKHSLGSPTASQPHQQSLEHFSATPISVQLSNIKPSSQSPEFSSVDVFLSASNSIPVSASQLAQLDVEADIFNEAWFERETEQFRMQIDPLTWTNKMFEEELKRLEQEEAFGPDDCSHLDIYASPDRLTSQPQQTNFDILTEEDDGFSYQESMEWLEKLYELPSSPRTMFSETAAPLAAEEEYC